VKSEDMRLARRVRGETTDKEIIYTGQRPGPARRVKKANGGSKATKASTPKKTPQKNSTPKKGGSPQM
jgi:hypothetical protein